MNGLDHGPTGNVQESRQRNRYGVSRSGSIIHVRSRSSVFARKQSFLLPGAPGSPNLNNSEQMIEEGFDEAAEELEQKSTVDGAAIMNRVANTELKPDHEEYDEILGKEHDDRTSEDVFKLALLTKGIKFFEKLGADVSVSLCKVMNVLSVPQGHRVFSQGDFGDKFYILINGRVAIVKELPLGPGEDPDDPTVGYQPPQKLRSEHSTPRSARSDASSEGGDLEEEDPQQMLEHLEDKLRSLSALVRRSKNELAELEVQNSSEVSDKRRFLERLVAERRELKTAVVKAKEAVVVAEQLAAPEAKAAASAAAAGGGGDGGGEAGQKDGDTHAGDGDGNASRGATTADQPPPEAKKKKSEKKKKKAQSKLLFLVRFHTGDTFGEIALESIDCQRTATVIAECDCKFVTIQKADYDRVLKHVMDVKKAEDVAFLRSVSIFTSWAPEQLGAIRPLMALVNLNHGATVCAEGQVAPFLYILKAGRVRVTKRATTDPQKFQLERMRSAFDSTDQSVGSTAGRGRDRGVDILLSVLGPGQIFGEQSMLSDRKCDETVTVDSGVAQFMTLTKLDVTRKFDRSVQDAIRKEYELKRLHRYRRMRTVIGAMVGQAKQGQLKKRGDILIPYPDPTDLVKLATPAHKARKKSASPSLGLLRAASSRSSSRPTTPSTMGTPKRGQTSTPGASPAQDRNLPRLASPVPTTGTTPSENTAPKADVTVEMQTSSFFLTQQGGSGGPTGLPVVGAGPGKKAGPDRQLHLGTWQAPAQHSANLNRLSALTLGHVATPHIVLDVDRINDLDDEPEF